MTRVVDAEFILGAPDLAHLPDEGLPEIAFAGRSNVGKSTLINLLTARKKLARSSSVPGRTRELNYFRITLEDGAAERRSIFLVDLPGFGFARVSKERREDLGRLTVDYIQSRQELQLVCLLNDCRRTPREDELALRDFVLQHDIPLLIILTKCDKLGKRELDLNIGKIADDYGILPELLVASDHNKPGQVLWQKILQHLK